MEQRVKQLKEMIEAEIRRRLVADRGVEAMARTLCRCMTYYRVQAAIRRAAGIPPAVAADADGGAA